MTLKRAKPLALGRCCWVCGRSGGVGATLLLEQAGYVIGLLPGTDQREIAYAHPRCASRALLRARRRAAAAVAARGRG